MKITPLVIGAMLLSALQPVTVFAESYTQFNVFVRRPSDNGIYTTGATEPGMGLSAGWTLIPNSSITSNPTAVSWGEKRIDVFGRSSTGTLLHWAWNSGVWAFDSNDHGGDIVGSPDCCSWAVGRVDIFARDSNNNCAHMSYDAGVWSAWNANFGAPTGGLTSDPGCVSWGANRLDVFVRGSNG